MLNNVSLMGRLTAAPELKTTPGGAYVCSFTLAVESSFKGTGGDRAVYWIDCQAWGKRAEFISRYFGKGSMIAITGRLQTRNWEDRQGGKRKSTEVVVEEASFCGSKPKDDGQASYSGEAGFVEVDDDGDLPF